MFQMSVLPAWGRETSGDGRDCLLGSRRKSPQNRPKASCVVMVGRHCGVTGEEYSRRLTARIIRPNAFGSLSRRSPRSLRSHCAIGAGGMGEVYRARDTRLNRTVALKVLPAESLSDPDLRARFEREAHAIAAWTIRTSARSTTSAESQRHGLPRDGASRRRDAARARTARKVRYRWTRPEDRDRDCRRARQGASRRALSIAI